MDNTVKILAFAGAARRGSVNKRLANAAAAIAEQAGAEVTRIDLADFPADIYNGDDETAKGLPATMRELKSLIASHDALLIATPEYNGHVPPLLVNVFSWTSRPEGDEAPNEIFTGKPVAIMAASPGGLGGVRVIPRLRDMLAELGCVTIPGFVTVANAYEAFDNRGELRSEQTVKQIAGLTTTLIDTVSNRLRVCA